MWDHTGQTDSPLIPESDKNATFTEYKAIAGVGDSVKLLSLGQADMHLCFGKGISKLVFTRSEAVMWAIEYKDKYNR